MLFNINQLKSHIFHEIFSDPQIQSDFSFSVSRSKSSL